MADRSPGLYLAYIVQALVGFNVILAAVFKPSDVAVGTVLFLMGLAVYLFSWKTRITFPWFVYFLTSLALLIHTSGYIQERYIKFVYWDVLAHTVSGTIVALIGFLVILYLDKVRMYNLDPLFVGIFIVLFGTLCEYLWEVWEFFMDTFFGGSLAGMMQANNADTMTDMIFVLASSLIVGAGCYYYLKRYGKDAIFHDMVKDSPYFNEMSSPKRTG